MVSAREEGAPSEEPTAATLLQLDIDVRLGADFWVEAWGLDERNEELIGALLRFAYGKGYSDALTEPERGKLCRDHGLTLPRRRRRHD